MPWRSRVSLALALPRLLVLVAVILLAASITQCRMVTDRIVRVEADDLSASSCIKSCTKAAKDAIEDENELHKDRLEACKGDDDDDKRLGAGIYRGDKPGDKDKPGKDDKKNACIAAEETRHKAALKAINDARMACIDGCHHQGGGTGR